MEKEMQHLSNYLRMLGTCEIQPLGRQSDVFDELRFLQQVDVITMVEKVHVCLLIQVWPGHSGHDLYPVPHPLTDPETAFNAIWNHWAPGAYGNNRRSLCIWLADTLQVEANEYRRTHSEYKHIEKQGIM